MDIKEEEERKEPVWKNGGGREGFCRDPRQPPWEVSPPWSVVVAVAAAVYFVASPPLPPPVFVVARPRRTPSPAFSVLFHTHIASLFQFPSHHENKSHTKLIVWYLIKKNSIKIS